MPTFTENDASCSILAFKDGMFSRAGHDVKLEAGKVTIEVDRERVIERFVRLDNSRTESGSGLGLSLVGAVMEAHGGRIILDEGPGAYGGFGPGLRVALVLPAAE